MSRSTPICQLKCSRCQAKQTPGQRWGKIPRTHFNVHVIGRVGNRAKCECRECGYIYTSGSRAAKRRLSQMEAKQSKDERNALLRDLAQGYADPRGNGVRLGPVHLFEVGQLLAIIRIPLCGRKVKKWNFDTDSDDDFCPKCLRIAKEREGKS